jgi:pentatricopeptide repeat protein
MARNRVGFRCSSPIVPSSPTSITTDWHTRHTTPVVVERTHYSNENPAIGVMHRWKRLLSHSHARRGAAATKTTTSTTTTPLGRSVSPAPASWRLQPTLSVDPHHRSDYATLVGSFPRKRRYSETVIRGSHSSAYDASEYAKLRQRATELIQQPPGDLTPDDWLGIEKDMVSLIQKNTLETVELCLRLLDRLAAEQGVVQALTRASWVDDAVVAAVLRSWCHLVRQESNLPSTFVNEHGPVQMVEKVHHYCKAFRQVKWTSRIAYFIVAAYNAHVKSKNRKDGPSTASFATGVLETIINAWKQGNEDAEPAAELLQAVANACTSRTIPQEQRRHAAVTVDDLLVMTVEVLGRTPDARLFSSSVNAWALTRSEEGAKKAHERLDEMWEVRHVYDSVPGWIWVNALRSAIQAWTWANHPDTLGRVGVLLVLAKNFVETELISPEDKMLPIWNAALQAFAVVGTPEAAAQALELAKIFNEADEPPDRITFYWYTASLVNGGQVEQGEAFLLDAIQKGLVEPKEDILSMVLRGWARSQHDDKYGRALRFLEEMGRLSNGRIVPSTATYDALLECCASSVGDPDYLAKEGLRLLSEMRRQEISSPDSSVSTGIKSFSFAVKSLARIGDYQRSEALYEQMLATSEKQHDAHLQPDSNIFNTVLEAFNNSTNAGALKGAIAFFQRSLERHKAGELREGPDSYSFTVLVSCIARSIGEGPAAMEKAKIVSLLLRQLESMYSTGENQAWQPDTSLYNAVMYCWAKAGSPRHCEAILDQMLGGCIDGKMQAAPNIQSFNILLDAVATSKSESAPERADATLSRIRAMHKDGLLRTGPNVSTYIAVIRCHLIDGGHRGIARSMALVQEAQKEYEIGNLDTNPAERMISLINKAKAGQAMGT